MEFVSFPYRRTTAAKKIVRIPEFDHEGYIKCLRDGDFDKLSSFSVPVDNAWKKVYCLISDGTYHTASFVSRSEDCEDNYLWYILHRSTRPGYALQLSVIHVKNGTCYPLSHSNINSLDDFLREVGNGYNVEIA